MGEGALPGGVFRRSAPGEFEINIPGIAESPVNKIIRRAYLGKQKGLSTTRTPDDKLYPRGFTPPIDFITDTDNAQGIYSLSSEIQNNYPDLPVEYGVQVNLDGKKRKSLKESYLRLQESPLRFFDSPMVQFRHLIEYNDVTTNYSIQNPITVGEGGNRPGIGYQYEESTGKFIPPTYLASFIKTHRENEDPTLLGFDFSVRLSNSPLFNGSLEEFLIQEGEVKGNLELLNRYYILKEFQKQFLNFFKSYEPNHISENLPSVGQFLERNDVNSSVKSGQLTNDLLKNKDGSTQDPLFPQDATRDMRDTFLGSATKAYYVQSISGLNKLNEQNDYGSSDGGRFVKWKSDVLTITVNEDVSQNMGYLASLYKNLAWSREHGRLAVPENLLRFEVVLDITEIRNYLRVYQNKLQSSGRGLTVDVNNDKKEWLQIADQTSKYRYFIHECQLFFPIMPHGDILSTSPIEFSKGLDMKIYFKNANLRFMKFNPPTTVKVADNDYTSYLERYRNNQLNNTDDVFRVKVIDNSVSFIKNGSEGDNLLSGGKSDTPRKTIWDNGNLDPTSRNTSPITYPVELFEDFASIQKNNVNLDTGLSDEQRRREINRRPSFTDKLNVGAKNTFRDIKRGLLNRGVNLINLQLISVASLLNRTLNQIYNSTPVIGGIKPPKNLYTAPNEFEQAYIDFIGPGLKTFFQDPLKFRKEGKAGETLEEKITRGREENPTPRPARNLNNYFQLANQAEETTNNKKLQKIVDDDPNLGISGTRIPKTPSLGNNAKQGPNKKIQKIVDDDPNLGNGFSGSSQIPFLGNSAESGSNRSLEEIVKSNPQLGIAGSNISTIPSLGNNADSGNNLTLEQIVSNDPDLGVPGSNISTIPSLGNSAESGQNLTLDQIVKLNPELGIPGSNISTIPSLGNNAEIGQNSTLQQIVDSDPDIGIPGSNISTIPSLGNNAEVGQNSTLQQIVDSDPNLGNGSNIPNISYLGNSSELGVNLINDEVVDTYSTVTNPSLGNSSDLGQNISNDSTVDGNSRVESPFIGNSAESGQNTINNELVDLTSRVIDPELGNSGLQGQNITNTELVDDKSKIKEPQLGNSGIEGVNLKSQKIVDNKSVVDNQDLGNSGNLSKNQKNFETVSEQTILQNPDFGNSGVSGRNNDLQGILKSTTIQDTPELGNSGRLSGNSILSQTVERNTSLFTAELGNSGESRSNSILNETVISNSKIHDSGVGNSADVGQNLILGEKIENNSKLENPELGNNSNDSKNLNSDKIIQNYTGVIDGEVGNSAHTGVNIVQDKKVQLNTQIEGEITGNSGRSGKNLNLGEFSRYSKSRILGTVDWNNIQFPKFGNKYPPPRT